MFKIKARNYLELLTSETIKLLECAENKIIKSEYGVSVPHLYIKCNSYQENSRVLYALVPNKFFGQLLSISPKNFIFLKSFDLGLSCIDVWFTDQDFKLLEIEDKVNIPAVINQSVL